MTQTPIGAIQKTDFILGTVRYGTTGAVMLGTGWAGYAIDRRLGGSGWVGAGVGAAIGFVPAYAAGLIAMALYAWRT